MPNVILFITAAVLVTINAQNAFATSPPVICTVSDRACVIEELKAAAQSIDNENWRDQIYRELAKTLAFDKRIDDAIIILNKIKSPDTKALTIRGIGMAAADNALSTEDYNAIFTALRFEAEKITHKPSYAIALTYIAMAQAFAGDDDGARKTASDMENDALRHKAYGETAEIQAEKGKFAEAMKSIETINSTAYRNKAYTIVSKILADHGKLEDAHAATLNITNAYKKAQSLQYILDVQKPRESERK